MFTDNPDVLFAINAVRRACLLARQIQAETVNQALEKSDRSPVTIADFAVQALVSHALDAHAPNDVLVGEESSGALRDSEQAAMLAQVTTFAGPAIGGATGGDVCNWIDRGAGDPGKRFWTLDPIDGTKGFLRSAQYAVALALIEDGRVTLGVLGCPVLSNPAAAEQGNDGVIVAAERGKGTWCQPLDESRPFERLHVSKTAEPSGARFLRSVEAGHTSVGQMDEIVHAMNVEAEPVRMDSQAKYAVLAAGGGEAIFRLLNANRPDYKECIWDQAAGSIVLEEAGGRITDLSGAELDFGQGRNLVKNSGVLATNGLLHDAALDAIAKTS
jgi:3'(2'), 5'-bisphosphate nucleotidase